MRFQQSTRWVVPGSLLLLLSLGNLWAQDPLDIGHTERADLHVVMDWPLIVTAVNAKDDQACGSLKADDLEIIEDGHAVRVSRLGRARGRVTHLLLIDTSRSMSADRGILQRRLSQTKLAARHYLDLVSGGLSLGEDDRLGILTFDDDLVMYAPPVRLSDPARLAELRDSIAPISGGYNTAFLDGLYRVVDSVDGLDERFVVIVISDGEDTFSALTETDVRRQIARANNLMIFAIGIGLRQGPHRALLNFLAEVTGGNYYDVGDSKDAASLSAGLRRHFTDIHERLTHQHYATYVTRRFGGADVDGDPFVDVRIRARGDDCRVSGYKRQRYVQPQNRSPLEAGVHWQLPDDRPTSGTAVLRLGIRDFSRDAGPLAAWGNEPEKRPAKVARVADRTVELLVPELEVALRAGTLDPLELVDGWIDTQLPGGEQQVPPASHLGPRMINGKAFLHNRDLPARAVFDSFSAYRDWVKAELEPELRSRYRDALPADYSDEQVEFILQARLEQPRSEDLEQRLAAWLGDVGALDLAFALERKWTNAWAGGGGGGPELQHVRSRWQVLVDWLRPPDQVRVVVPLLLSYDGDRDVFGFHRIVLPRLRQLPDSQVPDLPVGLEVFALLTSGNGHGETPGCHRIRAVEHHRLQPKELPPDAFPRRALRDREFRRLKLRLAGESCGDIDLDLVAEIVDGETRPFCTLTVEGADPQAAASLLAGQTIPACNDLVR